MASIKVFAEGQFTLKGTLENRHTPRDLFVYFQSFTEKFKLLSALPLLVVTVAPAQQPLNTLLVDVDHRPAISLDGPWHYLVDMTGTNLYTVQGKIRDNTYALNQRLEVARPTKPAEYNFTTARTLSVPRSAHRRRSLHTDCFHHLSED
jgi:hypothetical protein